MNCDEVSESKISTYSLGADFGEVDDTISLRPLLPVTKLILRFTIPGKISWTRTKFAASGSVLEHSFISGNKL